MYCSITYSYISQLRVGKIPPPPSGVSEALAQVCGIDKNILILEAYLDKAPDTILKFIYNVRYFEHLKLNNVFPGELPSDPNKIDAHIEIIKDLIDKEPLPEYILNYVKKEDEYYLKAGIDGFEDFMRSEPDTFITVDDYSMESVIPVKSDIVLSNKPDYTSGDIIAYSLIGDNTVFVRKCLIDGETITCIPINNEYAINTYNKKDILVLGKVKSIISSV